jgi:dipeptidase D
LEINAGRANANKLTVRFVYDAIIKEKARLASWEGGNMRNAIPREVQVVVTVPVENEKSFLKLVADFETIFNEEYGVIETPVVFVAERVDLPKGIVPEEIQDVLVRSIYACPDGMMRMIPAIPDTVETSSNLAIIAIGSGEVAIKILARSSCDSMKTNVANSLESCFSLIGMKVERTGEYSGWQPNVNSPILQTMKVSYKELFRVEPEVKVVHAGLECGIIGANIKGLDMISFGPTLRSPHSPDERVYIPSVTKFYDFLTATLGNIPVKE